MVIRKLCAEDYDELLSVLNTTFTRQNKREMNFLVELPRMWERSDEYMSKHIGLFEDGKLCATVGVYPLPVRICGEELLFATTGNVATLPEYEGRGYFSTLFPLAMQELERGGYDMARLGGQRQRYERFGFIDAGQLYRCILTEANRRKCLGEPDSAITFSPFLREDIEALSFARILSNEKPFHVEREGNDSERDVFRCLHNKHCKAYVARKNGTCIGYVCATKEGKKIHELRARDCSDFMAIVCAWQAYVGDTVDIPVSPDMQEELASLRACAQDVTLIAPTMFRAVRWERVCNALMKLSHTMRELPKGELILKVKGYGVLRLFVNENGVGCELADGEEPMLSLGWQDASNLLFGPFAPTLLGEPLPLFCHVWFPLPLTWNFLDIV